MAARDEQMEKQYWEEAQRRGGKRSGGQGWARSLKRGGRVEKAKGKRARRGSLKWPDGVSGGGYGRYVLCCSDKDV